MPHSGVLHSPHCLSRPQRGYVLFDALAALLLLTCTLLGAGLALVQSLAGSRAAALQTSAVDLAADFLMQMIESVRRGNGSEESILAAMARIQKAGNDYAGVLYREHMEAE